MPEIKPKDSSPERESPSTRISDLSPDESPEHGGYRMKFTRKDSAQYHNRVNPRNTATENLHGDATPRRETTFGGFQPGFLNRAQSDPVRGSSDVRGRREQIVPGGTRGLSALDVLRGARNRQESGNQISSQPVNRARSAVQNRVWVRPKPKAGDDNPRRHWESLHRNRRVGPTVHSASSTVRNPDGTTTNVVIQIIRHG